MKKTLLLLILIPVVAAAAFLLDHQLTRSGRIHFEQRKNDLLAVYDEILRYEYEHLALPGSLAVLTPHYLREDQLIRDGESLYTYDPEHRTVALSSGERLGGLFGRVLPAAGMSLPDPVDYAKASGMELVADRVFVPQGPEGVKPPDGALVIEAEHYTELNYGWEVHPDPSCGGGAYAYSKEGMGNGPGQWGGGIFNFYDIHEGKEFTRIRWHFHLDTPGEYAICGRIWTTGSHCSNCIIVGIDGAAPLEKNHYQGTRMRNEEPFRWVWTTAEGGPVQLKAGDHFLEAYLHEDGVLVDQFMISPVPVSGDSVVAGARVPIDQKTSFRAQPGPPVALAFDLKSMVITPDLPPVCNLTFRRLRAAAGIAKVSVRLKNAGADGADLDLGSYLLDLAGKEELLFLPIDFGKLDLRTLPRREYLLVAEMTQKGATLATAQVPLIHPMKWEVCGPFPQFTNDQKGPLDAAAEPTGDDELTGRWSPFKDDCYDLFGVLDFGLQSIGNSLHAPEKVTMYAQTRINVPESKDYLLKLQSDDQMLLWIDGKLIYNHDKKAPVTRSAMRLTHHLEAGPHTVRMRVNNLAFTSFGDGRWQASLRFRTTDDDLSQITGL